jgi:hypothetical protein
MRVVYYSLANTPGSVREEQWIQSIRSLRRHNPDIPVWLILFNGGSVSLFQETSRWGVTVHERGDYCAYLENLSGHASKLAAYPTFHKFFSLAGSPVDGLSQILYVDCDTFFFGNVDQLFERYRACDWYAREEPFSRLSHLGYQPNHLDEEVLAGLVRQEGVCSISPFNSGVCMLNNHVWRHFGSISGIYLDYAWRLMTGQYLRAAVLTGRGPRIGDAALESLRDGDIQQALPYPSSNPWIIDQIALWLTLGRVPDLSLDLLLRSEVVQGGEFHDALARERCVVAHYFSLGGQQFFSVVPPIME